MNAPLAVRGDSVLAHTANGSLVALDSRDGRERWSADLGATSVTALGDSQTFVSDDTMLSGVTDEEEASAWQTRSFGAVAASATSGSTLYVANADGVIFAIK